MTEFLETEAILLALEDDEELYVYLRCEFYPGELKKLAKAARHLAWAANDAAAELERAKKTSEDSLQ